MVDPLSYKTNLCSLLRQVIRNPENINISLRTFTAVHWITNIIHWISLYIKPIYLNSKTVFFNVI